VKTTTLNLTSKVKNLFLHNFQVEINRPVDEINSVFKQKPNLPGAIISENGKLVGVISRKKYAEYMSRPYSLDLFLNRPIQNLHDFIKTDFLLLPGKTSITKAMQKLIERSLDLIEEPLVIEIAPQVYRLLDVNQLIVAHSEIQIYAKHLISKLYKEIKISNSKLKELATIDGLTGVSNRRKFDEFLEREWKRGIREQIPISLILSDVDCFKSYNDTYGHQAGDSCLRAIARAMIESVRRPGDLVARYGGEEFAIVLPNTDVEGAICIAEKIRKNIVTLKIDHSKSVVANWVTVSLGIVTLIPNQARDRSPKKLIEAADRALYAAKRTGRNRYLIYSSELERCEPKTKKTLDSVSTSTKQVRESWYQLPLEKANSQSGNFPEKVNSTHIIDAIRLSTVRANLASSEN